MRVVVQGERWRGGHRDGDESGAQGLVPRLHTSFPGIDARDKAVRVDGHDRHAGIRVDELPRDGGTGHHGARSAHRACHEAKRVSGDDLRRGRSNDVDRHDTVEIHELGTGGDDDQQGQEASQLAASPSCASARRAWSVHFCASGPRGGLSRKVRRWVTAAAFSPRRSRRKARP